MNDSSQAPCKYKTSFENKIFQIISMGIVASTKCYTSSVAVQIHCTGCPILSSFPNTFVFILLNLFSPYICMKYLPLNDLQPAINHCYLNEKYNIHLSQLIVIM